MRKTGITLQNIKIHQWVVMAHIRTCLNKTCDATVNENYIFNINMVYLVLGEGSNGIIITLTAFLKGCRGWDSVSR